MTTDARTQPVLFEPGEVQPPDTTASDPYPLVEAFESGDEPIRRRITLNAVPIVDATLAIPAAGEYADPKGRWWRDYLEGTGTVRTELTGGTVRSIDLFCGPGGLANGVRQFCREAGMTMISELAVDQDEEAAQIYAANHLARRRSTESVSALVDYQVRGNGQDASFVYEPEILDPDLARHLTEVDLVLAGPPCQGHSNLNNHSRRTDRRNELYLTVPATAIAIGARMAIVENVAAILNDPNDVVGTARTLFERAGYTVDTRMLTASAIGWPQTRKRHFLIARRDRAPLPLSEVAGCLSDASPRDLWWAISDLEDTVGDDPMTQVTELSEENQARIDWLFDNDAYELALGKRPKSHRDGTTYTAVYGRMRRDRPAPTITTGFMTPGRGRFTHPTRRRVLTAREAARLQGFPDDYVFVPDPGNPPSRAKLAKWIGDAVPMPLGYAAALSALGPGLPGA